MLADRVIRHERVDVDVLRARDARQLWRSHLVRRRVRVPVSWFGRSVMKAGSMPGGDAVCHGHHVWDEDECLRCGLLDLTYHEKPQPADL